MSEQNGRLLRIAIDAGLFVSLLSLAFWTGRQSQKIADLQEAVTTPGRVQISIEARERLAKLETDTQEMKRRIEALERK